MGRTYYEPDGCDIRREVYKEEQAHSNRYRSGRSGDLRPSTRDLGPFLERSHGSLSGRSMHSSSISRDSRSLLAWSHGSVSGRNRGESFQASRSILEGRNDPESGRSRRDYDRHSKDGHRPALIVDRKVLPQVLEKTRELRKSYEDNAGKIQRLLDEEYGQLPLSRGDSFSSRRPPSGRRRESLGTTGLLMPGSSAQSSGPRTYRPFANTSSFRTTESYNSSEQSSKSSIASHPDFERTLRKLMSSGDLGIPQVVRAYFEFAVSCIMKKFNLRTGEAIRECGAILLKMDKSDLGNAGEWDLQEEFAVRFSGSPSNSRWR